MASSTRDFFSEQDIAALKDAIAAAEELTSGEIRVHLEETCKDAAIDRAVQVFARLDMHKTKEHNGILFYLAVQSRKFAVAGDRGIHEKVGAEFWDSLAACMESHFREGRFTQGLCEAIAEAGKQLREHFPHQSDDTNELSNEISIS